MLLPGPDLVAVRRPLAVLAPAGGERPPDGGASGGLTWIKAARITERNVCTRAVAVGRLPQGPIDAASARLSGLLATEGVRGNVSTYRLLKGLDLPLAGAPEQVIEPAARSTAVALLAEDYVGLKPLFRVAEGDEVRRGQLLFEDRANPGVRFTAPAAGRIAAINRGERRAFVSLVIAREPGDRPEPAVPFASFRGTPPETLSRAELVELLVESGLWTALRTRPFSRVPPPESAPEALFVTAMDSRPHAPAVDHVLDGQKDDFALGLACLAKLSPGPTYLCCAENSRVAEAAGPGVTVAQFAGPHPAGIAGTHIHILHPADLDRRVWHIGYQDVAAVGRLLRTGELDTSRVVALAGPSVTRPRLFRARLGAALDGLVAGEVEAGCRVVSGSVLDGRTAMGPVEGYLGRYHLQVSALPEPEERELFGWIRPGGDKFSIWRVVLSAFQKPTALRLTTSTNGGKRAMVPIGSFERVMPLDLLPTFLLRALLMGDIERAFELGCIELDEEDLALCTFVCPGKAEYGPLLRRVLERIEKEIA